MRDLDLTTLRLFVQVCETRNIARAGEQAHLAGSAISKRLAQLEDTVGVKLLTRRRHGVEPTEAGETLLEHARSILGSSERIERDMSAYSAGVRGQVRILASVSALAESLPADIAAFLKHETHGGIHVDIEERQSTGVVRGVREGVAALGICWDAADFQGLETRPYRADRLGVIMPRNHPLARRKKLRFAQTLDYEHVVMPVNSALLRLLQSAAGQENKVLNYRVAVSNFDSAFRVVQAGLAINVAPVEIAAPYARVHDLKVIELTDAWARRRFALCMRSAGSLGAASALLLDYLERRAESNL